MSKFDDDPTVFCSENPYPLRCQNSYHPAELKLAREYASPYYYAISSGSEPGSINAIRLPCTDFYNASDGGLLWWQALQREATFLPELGAVHGYSKPCINNSNINFFIHQNNTTGLPYVDGQRGHLLRQPRLNRHRNDTIAVCLTNTNPAVSRAYGFNVIYSLLYCLYNYGDGLRKYRPNEIEALILYQEKNKQ